MLPGNWRLPDPFSCQQKHARPIVLRLGSCFSIAKLHIFLAIFVRGWILSKLSVGCFPATVTTTGGLAFSGLFGSRSEPAHMKNDCILAFWNSNLM